MTDQPTRRPNAGLQTGEPPEHRVADLLRVLEIIQSACGNDRSARTLKAVGVNPGSVYSIWECFSFKSGDILIVFTDGFIESSAPDGSPFGTERICKAVLRYRALCATEIIQRIYAELLRHVKDQKQPGDLTIVIVKKL